MKQFRFCWAMGMVLVVLSGCGREVSKDFGSSNSKPDDDEDPSQKLLIFAPSAADFAAQRMAPAMADQFVRSTRQIYEARLKTFDALKKAEGMEKLISSCRETYASAVKFTSTKSETPEALKSESSAAVAALTACRDEALSAEKSAGSAGRKTAAMLKRFATAGMALVGMSTVSKGDDPEGMKIWNDASVLVEKDDPPFKFSWKHFFGLQQ